MFNNKRTPKNMYDQTATLDLSNTVFTLSIQTDSEKTL